MTILVIPTYASNDDVGAEIVEVDRISYFNMDLDTLSLYDGFSELDAQYGESTDFVSDTHDGVMMRVTRDTGQLEYYSIEYKNEVVWVGLNSTSDKFYGWESTDVYDTTSPTYVYRAVTTNGGISYVYSALTSSDYVSVGSDCTDIDIFHTDYDVYTYIDSTQTKVYDLTASSSEFDSLETIVNGQSVFIYNSSESSLTVSVKIGEDTSAFSNYRWRYVDESANKTSVQYFAMQSYNYHGIAVGDWILIDNIGSATLDIMYDDADAIVNKISINSGDNIYYNSDYLFQVLQIFDTSDLLYQFCVGYQAIIGYDEIRFHSLTRAEVGLIMDELIDMVPMFTEDDYIPLLKLAINDMLGLLTGDDAVVDNPMKTVIVDKGHTIQFYNGSAFILPKITIEPYEPQTTVQIAYYNEVVSSKQYFDITESAIYTMSSNAEWGDFYITVIDAENNGSLKVTYDSTETRYKIGDVADDNDDFNLLDIDSLTEPIRSNYALGWQGSMQYAIDTVIYWVMMPLHLIAYALGSVVNSVLNVIDKFNDSLLFIGAIFTWLPEELQGLTVLGLSTIILVGIIQMIRK